jgi:hypothetical protein
MDRIAMIVFAPVAAVVTTLSWSYGTPLIAGQAAQAPAASIKVCGLLPRAEVKKLIGGDQIFDMMAPEEEAIGNYGSSCNYPGVMVQVLPFQQQTIDAVRKRGKLVDVAGVGDAAYAFDNPAGYAELYVKVGTRLLTLQRDVPPCKTQADVRPGAIALAMALVPKLR